MASEEPDEVDVWPPGFSYPDPSALPLVFVPVPEPKNGKNRVHLDLATESATAPGGRGEAAARPGRGAAPTSGRATCRGPSWPTRRATSSACSIRGRSTGTPARSRPWWPTAPTRLPWPGSGRTVTGWAPATSTASGLSLRSPDGIGPYLELLPSADPKVGKNRVHLDVAPYQDEDHAAAILALTGAGAVRLDIGQGDVPWTVLADPEGSEFCVLSPR